MTTWTYPGQYPHDPIFDGSSTPSLTGFDFDLSKDAVAYVANDWISQVASNNISNRWNDKILGYMSDIHIWDSLNKYVPGYKHDAVGGSHIMVYLADVNNFRPGSSDQEFMLDSWVYGRLYDSKRYFSGIQVELNGSFVGTFGYKLHQGTYGSEIEIVLKNYSIDADSADNFVAIEKVDIESNMKDAEKDIKTNMLKVLNDNKTKAAIIADINGGFLANERIGLPEEQFGNWNLHFNKLSADAEYVKIDFDAAYQVSQDERVKKVAKKGIEHAFKNFFAKF